MEYSQFAAHKVIGHLGLNLLYNIVYGCGIVSESKDTLVIGGLLLPGRVVSQSTVECLQQFRIHALETAAVSLASNSCQTGLDSLDKFLILG